ncbi:DUF4235 domain-containing protein [Streptomyces johnsoniae]|uniref:DUF4235 domain-containing protein n=1 Tax=Streptomyces johnsoniae TaxID=3075532 RepID=A0ABU2S2D2_9ACTN|nr:DUF4235 domain-containing protein [Streptomyces sp. DSM 41886]MDT0442250.1 DUF4235 domain-containing protein [Streptomyces sp. DSM 41886]
MNATKAAYRPVGLISGTLGGLVAGAVFKQGWKSLRHDEHTWGATDRDRSWREIWLAAAAQGAVFAVVKATVDRAGAKAVHRATGTWPG